MVRVVRVVVTFAGQRLVVRTRPRAGLLLLEAEICVLFTVLRAVDVVLAFLEAALVDVRWTFEPKPELAGAR